MYTYMTKYMKVIVITISNAVIKFGIYFENEWFINFIFFNDSIFVHHTIHLLKRDFIQKKIFKIK